MSYTPGPWKVGQLENMGIRNKWVNIYGTTGWCKGQDICRVRHDDLVSEEESGDDALGNTYLIAAAPALVEALEMAMERGHSIVCPSYSDLVSDENCNCYLKTAKRALAQATGQGV